MQQRQANLRKAKPQGSINRVKKAPTKRRSPQAKAAPTSSAQSAKDRRLAEAQLRTLIIQFAPKYQRLISATRRSLKTRLPTALELVYEYRDFFVISYSPNEHGYEGVLGIRASADGVKLYFNRGKELADPAKLLRGSGKQARAIDLTSASTLTQPAVKDLIDQAIAHNQISFPSNGAGAVIIRSAATKVKSKPTRK